MDAGVQWRVEESKVQEDRVAEESRKKESVEEEARVVEGDSAVVGDTEECQTVTEERTTDKQGRLTDAAASVLWVTWVTLLLGRQRASQKRSCRGQQVA